MGQCIEVNSLEKSLGAANLRWLRETSLIAYKLLDKHYGCNISFMRKEQSI